MTTLADLSRHPDPLVRALAAECMAWRLVTEDYQCVSADVGETRRAREATDAALKERKP